jgi:hypothetical protein
MRYPIAVFCALALTAGQVATAQTSPSQKGPTAPKNDFTIVEPPGLNLGTLKEIVAGANFANPTLHGEALKAAATVAFGLLWDPIGKAITHTELCASARGALNGPPQEGGQHLFSYAVNIQSSFGGSIVQSYQQTYMAFVADGGIYYVPITKLKDGQIIYGKPEPCTKFKGDDKLSTWKTAVYDVFHFDGATFSIAVYLPGDIRAGDTISGTVLVEPSGDTPAARASSMAQLSGYVIDTGDKQTPVTDGRLLLSIGAAGGLVPLILRDANGATVAISGSNASPSTAPVSVPQPVGAVSPAARPMSIPGFFDGNAENTRATYNGQPVEVIAESPRISVLNCPPGMTGPVEIIVTDPKSTVTAETNLVGIKLSAAKLNLLRGEKTVVSVEIMGLQGLREPLSVNLKASPNVRLGGGNSQTIKVDPLKVDASGVVRRQFSLQSKVPGPFEVKSDLLPPKARN